MREELRGRLLTLGGGRAVVTISGRVLIAEDETIIRLDLRAMLERAGFDGGGRGPGRRARRSRWPPSTGPTWRVMDVKMPELDGIEAARRMLEQRPIPIVMLTAFSERELVARAVDAGVFGYLVKPFRESDLLPAIETARARARRAAGGARGVRPPARRARVAQADRACQGPADGERRADRGRGVRRMRGASQRTSRTLRDIAEAMVETLAK